MPKYRYDGDGECRYGTAPVRKGDIIEASGPPGKRFVLVVETMPPQEKSSIEVTESFEETPVRSKRSRGGGE